jgi:hypothetical protein
MKRSFFITTMVMLAISMSAFAQGGGGFQRRTVEERVQIAHQKLDSAFKLDATQLKKVDAAFTTYYTATDKMREDMRNSGEQPDRETMRAKTQPLIEARDKELKATLGDANFKKWKDEIEPSMQPRFGGGGGGRN